MSMKKALGRLAALQVRIMTALQEVAHLRGDGMLDWLLSNSAEAEQSIIEACDIGWNKLVERWEKYSEIIDPHTFFQNREGLCVSSGFQTLVLAKIAPNAVGQIVPVKSIALEGSIPDSVIEPALGAGHLFEEVSLCVTIAKMIQEQWGGKEGQLLNNGKENLFYTFSCVVSVRWSTDHCRWFVRVWDRDPRRWPVGILVFSPATAD